MKSQFELEQLPLISEIQGDLTISEGVSQLQRFACLRSVTGMVSVRYTRSLVTLEGLERLDSIGADLTLYQNDTLTNVTGLRGLKSVGGSIVVKTNFKLAELRGFDNLTSVRIGIQIEGNADLLGFHGPDELLALGGLELVGNPKLSDVQGFANLATLANLLVRDNTALAALDALPALKLAYQDIVIENNATLAAIAGLSALETVEQSLTIANNPELVRIHGLAALESIHQNLVIIDNPKLSTCLAAELAERSGAQAAQLEGNDDSTTCRPVVADGVDCYSAKLQCAPGEACIVCGVDWRCVPDQRRDPGGYETATAQCSQTHLVGECDGPEDCPNKQYCVWGQDGRSLRCSADPAAEPIDCCFSCFSALGTTCTLCWTDADCPFGESCAVKGVWPNGVGGCRPAAAGR